ncbi:MAG: hypothetical protein R2822_16960 [Spirosomataceae bacterium]
MPYALAPAFREFGQDIPKVWAALPTKKTPHRFLLILFREGRSNTGLVFCFTPLRELLFEAKFRSKTWFSTGLVLDKNSNKMSKRLGNTIEPFRYH